MEVPQEGHRRTVSAFTGAPQFWQKRTSDGIECPHAWQVRSNLWFTTPPILPGPTGRQTAIGGVGDSSVNFLGILVQHR